MIAMTAKVLRLLLVEDSENDALLIMSALKTGGYRLESERVYTAVTMREALAKQTWDVIICDYKIPRFGAHEALKLVNEMNLDLPFIVVSGAMGENTAVEMMRAGAADYLMKDNLLRLAPAIERELKDAKDRAERRRAQELSSRLGRIIDNSPNEVFVFNATNLKVIQANKGAMRNSSYAWESLQEMILYDLAPELSPEKFAELTQALYNGEQDTIVCEMMIRRRNGSVYPAEVILSLSSAESPPALLAIMQDISERKQVQEELLASAQRLERSNQELQSFAHIASHDLQEPLRKVQLFSSRIEEKYADLIDSDGKEYIQRMQNAVQRMQAMINDLLKYARLSDMEQQLELVDLNSVLQEVIGDLEVQIEQVQGTLQFDALPIVPAYPIQMYQLFQNLLSNAFKYHQADLPPMVKITCEYLPKQCCIVVEDNGIGFPPESSERIFGFFQRLHGRSEYRGNGIGLAICRKIMDNHAGTIRAESEPGRGSKFIVTLPIPTMF
jgi:PAS domain S-box-containing protein